MICLVENRTETFPFQLLTVTETITQEKTGENDAGYF